MFDEIDDWTILSTLRTSNLSEPLDLYYKVARELIASNRFNYISRGNFIIEQLNGNTGEEIFNRSREDWDIFDFKEDIVSVNDFKRGFLWCFRDHTTSWMDNQKAKVWFLTSPEAIFVRRYELWTCDNFLDECIEIKEGSYKEILQLLLKDGDYEVLCSPAFSKAELTEFIKKYNPEIGGYDTNYIIEEYIECNPNFID